MRLRTFTPTLAVLLLAACSRKDLPAPPPPDTASGPVSSTPRNAGDWIALPWTRATSEAGSVAWQTRIDAPTPALVFVLGYGLGRIPAEKPMALPFDLVSPDERTEQPFRWTIARSGGVQTVTVSVPASEAPLFEERLRQIRFRAFSMPAGKEHDLRNRSYRELTATAR